MFDKPDSDRIRQSLLEYESAAEAEWPLAASGRSLPKAQNALERLRTAYEEVQSRTDSQKTFLATSFDSLKGISQARTDRILGARTDVGPPWSLWAVFLLTSGLVLACSIVYGVEKPAIHYTLVATVGVLIATNLFSSWNLPTRTSAKLRRPRSRFARLSRSCRHPRHSRHACTGGRRGLGMWD